MLDICLRITIHSAVMLQVVSKISRALVMSGLQKSPWPRKPTEWSTGTGWVWTQAFRTKRYRTQLARTSLLTSRPKTTFLSLGARWQGQGLEEAHNSVCRTEARHLTRMSTRNLGSQHQAGHQLNRLA